TTIWVLIVAHVASLLRSCSDHRALHALPTRRSSDLEPFAAEGEVRLVLQGVQGHVLDLEADVAARREPGGDQVLDDLLLPVDGDGPARHQLLEGDAVGLAAVSELDAVVGQALPQHALADAGRDERVDRTLLQHACPDAPFDVVAAPSLQHHRGDAAQVEQVRQQQARGPGTDDPYLCAHAGSILPPGPRNREDASTEWKVSARMCVWRADPGSRAGV